MWKAVRHLWTCQGIVGSSQLGIKVTMMGFWVPLALLVLSCGYYGDGVGGGGREPLWGGLYKMEIG